MQAHTRGHMRAEHWYWNKEHSNWVDDTKAWRKEIKSMLAEVADIKEMLKQHDEALKSHLDTIEAHEKTERDHEQALETQDLLETDEVAPSSFDDIHAKESESHEAQRNVHERMKRHQYTIVGRWHLVRDSLQSAM